MSKKKSKNGGLRSSANNGSDKSGHSSLSEWDKIETDFFARESDLYLTGPVESFDDLDD